MVEKRTLNAAETLEPTLAERRIIAAAAAGETCDFKTGDVTDDPGNAETWGPERLVRAEVVRALCLGLRADWPVDPRGVRISGAVEFG
jgi:hypothetical protein